MIKNVTGIIVDVDDLVLDVTGALRCLTDITDEAQQRDEIRHRAAHDALTGCLNRAAILATLTTSVTACTGQAGVAVLFFEIRRSWLPRPTPRCTRPRGAAARGQEPLDRVTACCGSPRATRPSSSGRRC